MISVANTISQYYTAMLYPFEQYYKNNMQDQQKRLAAARQGGAQQPSTTLPNQGRPMQGIPAGAQPGQIQQQRGVAGHPMGAMNHAIGSAQSPLNSTPQPPTPHSPLQRPASTSFNQLASGSSLPISSHDMNGHSSDTNVLDQEVQGIKRKMETDERDGKRARQKTGRQRLSYLMP